MLKTYFGAALKPKLHGGLRDAGDANYIKVHDRGVIERGRGLRPTTSHRYLIQYRHPIESIQSLFEFALHHEQGKLQDTADDWRGFLETNLAYWKRFVAKWCLELDAEVAAGAHRVEYERLCTDTEATLRGAVAFLNPGGVIDEQRLTDAVGAYSNVITRYVEDQRNKAVQRRDATAFRYFDDSLLALENELAADYLAPLGIRRFGERNP